MSLSILAGSFLGSGTVGLKSAPILDASTAKQSFDSLHHSTTSPQHQSQSNEILSYVKQSTGCIQLQFPKKKKKNCHKANHGVLSKLNSERLLKSYLLKFRMCLNSTQDVPKCVPRLLHDPALLCVWREDCPSSREVFLLRFMHAILEAAGLSASEQSLLGSGFIYTYTIQALGLNIFKDSEKIFRKNKCS